MNGPTGPPVETNLSVTIIRAATMVEMLTVFMGA